ncbi:MFS transporter [Candidatus Tisiphia endosymbiont of Ptychoptera albimana]|uniref:MFS transporter n=1 Tax=Candidatus Tisiphia endosymbiont of Ptychoptera albimana TaxID=3066260 RepID=UPI00312C8756
MKKKDLSILIGNSLDHFDTAIYSFLAPILSIIFFPKDDPIVALILTYSVLATAIITRPIGAIIFSIIVKKRGAALALSYSLIGVAVTTMLIGVIPTYQMIGWFSPLMLLIIRMMLAIFGEGEHCIAKLYIVENKTQTQGMKASYLYELSTMFGLIIASFVSTILISSNHHEYWRLCFILGGSTGIVGVYLRRYSNISQRAIEQESYIANLTNIMSNSQTSLQEATLVAMKKSREMRNGLLHGLTIACNDFVSYISNVILNNKCNILRVSIVSGFSYMTYVIPFVVMNSFIPLITSISLERMMTFNTILLIMDAAMIPIIGSLVKKYRPANVMIISTNILFVSIVPLWLYMSDASLWYINFVRLWIITLGVTFLCPLNYWLNSLFHGSDKYMLVSIGDAIGTSIFGRFTPSICIALWHFTGSSISIGIYIAMITLATIWAVRSIP